MILFRCFELLYLFCWLYIFSIFELKINIRIYLNWGLKCMLNVFLFKVLCFLSKVIKDFWSFGGGFVIRCLVRMLGFRLKFLERVC